VYTASRGLIPLEVVPNFGTTSNGAGRINTDKNKIKITFTTKNRKNTKGNNYDRKNKNKTKINKK